MSGIGFPSSDTRFVAVEGLAIVEEDCGVAAVAGAAATGLAGTEREGTEGNLIEFDGLCILMALIGVFCSLDVFFGVDAIGVLTCWPTGARLTGVCSILFKTGLFAATGSTTGATGCVEDD